MGLFDKLKKKEENVVEGNSNIESVPQAIAPATENASPQSPTVPGVGIPNIPADTFSQAPVTPVASVEPTLADNGSVASTNEIVPENPLQSVTETAATIEAPNPILEQQIALDVNPEEVFEGGPTTMYDEITNIVNSEVNSAEPTPIQTESVPVQAEPTSTPVETISLTNGPVNGLPDQTFESTNNTIIEETQPSNTQTSEPEKEVPVVPIEQSTEPVVDIAPSDAVIPPEIINATTIQEPVEVQPVESVPSVEIPIEETPLSVDTPIVPESPITEEASTPLLDNNVLPSAEPVVEQTTTEISSTPSEIPNIEVSPTVNTAPLEATQAIEPIELNSTQQTPIINEAENVEPIADVPIDSEVAETQPIEPSPIEPISENTLQDENFVASNNEAAEVPEKSNILEDTLELSPISETEITAEIPVISDEPEITPETSIESPEESEDKKLESSVIPENSPEETPLTNDVNEIYGDQASENGDDTIYEEINGDEIISGDEIAYVDEDGNIITEEESSEEVNPIVENTIESNENEITEINTSEENVTPLVYEEESSEETKESTEPIIPIAEEEINISSDDSEESSTNQPIIEEQEKDLVLAPEEEPSPEEESTSEEVKPIIEEDESDIVIPDEENEDTAEIPIISPIISEEDENIPLVSETTVSEKKEESSSNAETPKEEKEAKENSSEDKQSEEKVVEEINSKEDIIDIKSLQVGDDIPENKENEVTDDNQEESITLNHISPDEDDSSNAENDSATINPFADITPSAISLDIPADSKEEKVVDKKPQDFNPLAHNFDYKEKLKEYANMFDRQPANNKSEKTYISEPTRTKFCNNCGIMLTDDSSICPSCGEPVD